MSSPSVLGSCSVSPTGSALPPGSTPVLGPASHWEVSFACPNGDLQLLSVATTWRVPRRRWHEPGQCASLRQALRGLASQGCTVIAAERVVEHVYEIDDDFRIPEGAAPGYAGELDSLTRHSCTLRMIYLNRLGKECCGTWCISESELSMGVNQDLRDGVAAFFSIRGKELLSLQLVRERREALSAEQLAEMVAHEAGAGPASRLGIRQRARLAVRRFGSTAVRQFGKVGVRLYRGKPCMVLGVFVGVGLGWALASA